MDEIFTNGDVPSAKPLSVAAPPAQTKQPSRITSEPSEGQTDLVELKSAYMLPQRSMQHKVTIFYEEFENIFVEDFHTDAVGEIRSEDPAGGGSENADEAPEYSQTFDGNSNNATNYTQLISGENFVNEVNVSDYFILDGTKRLDGTAKLLSRDYNGETVQPVGWMSKNVSGEGGVFASCPRLAYTFSANHSIVRWAIRSPEGEFPAEFTVNIYDANGGTLYTKEENNNLKSFYTLDICKGLCRKIELVIKKWGVKKDNQTIYEAGHNARILYFYHNTVFPEGPTSYYSRDLLQSFAVNEYLCSSIGKANYGVQSNTGQFSLVNFDRALDALSYAGHLKNGLKVQYHVALDGYTEQSGESAGTGENADGWVLLATQYITDIEFDEVKNVVKFNTQDRLIGFKDVTYSGYKRIKKDEASADGNFFTLSKMCDFQLLQDIMSRAELYDEETVKSENDGQIPEEVGNHNLYRIAGNAGGAMTDREIGNAYLAETSLWAALQNVCDLDLVHIYIDREDVLVIDKFDQL